MNTLLKNLIICTLLLSYYSVKSQSNPFTGTDKIVVQEFNLSNFDKISILDLDGETEIEIGKPFSIQTSIKDKYTSILEVNESNRELTIVFKYTKDNNKYIKNPDIKVKISCPHLDSLYKRGNSKILVTMAFQKKIFVSNEGNGGVTLKGLVEQLSLINDGNGNLDARNLLADFVNVNSFGNGFVFVNARERLKSERNGNGKLVQMGKALINEK